MWVIAQQEAGDCKPASLPPSLPSVLEAETGRVEAWRGVEGRGLARRGAASSSMFHKTKRAWPAPSGQWPHLAMHLSVGQGLLNTADSSLGRIRPRRTPAVRPGGPGSPAVNRQGSDTALPGPAG